MSPLVCIWTCFINCLFFVHCFFALYLLGCCLKSLPSHACQKAYACLVYSIYLVMISLLYKAYPNGCQHRFASLAEAKALPREGTLALACLSGFCRFCCMMCTQVFLVGQQSACWLDVCTLTDCNMLYVYSQSCPLGRD